MEDKQYVKNADIIPELQKYKETGVQSEKLGEAFLIIARNLTNTSRFINYTKEWKEDMVMDAVLTCCKYIHNFDPDKSTNPFAYITCICDRAFKNFLAKQYKHKEIKDICYNFSDNVCNGTSYSIKAIDYTAIVDPIKKQRKEGKIADLLSSEAVEVPVKHKDEYFSHFDTYEEVSDDFDGDQY